MSAETAGPAGTAPDESVRTATTDDLTDLVHLAAAAVAEKLTQKGGQMWARREGQRRHQPEASLGEALDAADHEVAVGQFDGATLGYAVAHVETLPDGGRLGVVDDVYVDPRGRAVGLGEALMDHLLDWCRTQGCFGVDSLALPGDRSTKNFFESFGLVARAIVVHHPFHDQGS